MQRFPSESWSDVFPQMPISREVHAKHVPLAAVFSFPERLSLQYKRIESLSGSYFQIFGKEICFWESDRPVLVESPLMPVNGDRNLLVHSIPSAEAHVEGFLSTMGNIRRGTSNECFVQHFLRHELWEWGERLAKALLLQHPEGPKHWDDIRNFQSDFESAQGILRAAYERVMTSH